MFLNGIILINKTRYEMSAITPEKVKEILHQRELVREERIRDKIVEIIRNINDYILEYTTIDLNFNVEVCVESDVLRMVCRELENAGWETTIVRENKLTEKATIHIQEGI